MKASTLHPASGLDADINQSQPLHWVRNFLGRLRKAGSDRALRRQLSEMDDSLLRDIGISEDEIWRVRAQQSFMPRAWH